MTGERPEAEEVAEEEYIHFGTLEKTARNDEGIAEGVASGNIHKQSADQETLELSAASVAARERHEAILADFESRRKARALSIPTDDGAVRKKLRELGEPMTLFGEKQMERRDRLRMLLAKMDADDGGELAAPEDAEVLTEVPKEPELFYTEGSSDLLRCRGVILESSLRMAAERIAQQKRKREDPDEDEEMETKATLELVKNLSINSSEIGDERPLSACAFSPDGTEVVTSSWSGLCKLWTVGDAKKGLILRAHDERITGVCYHPRAGLDANQPVHIATASADRTARIWSREGKLLQTFKGHEDRLCRLNFHPRVHSLLATTSFDATWRLWDVETAQEVLLQEGHSRPVYDVGFHPDGSLCGTVGLDTHCRVWDLRVGRNILTLTGHVKQVLAISFSPNGHHVATGSDDHTCRVWDLRTRKSMYTIPAHSKLISQVRFEPVDGQFLLTASYDNTAKVWSGLDFKPVKTLLGHEGKIMGADVARGGEVVATASYDRTVKLWVQDKPPDESVMAMGDDTMEES
eukprot:CAMPEP_0198232380 /NCGR_PEP_ID=MMETSP1445-20131203/115701_1 /TAXON_ID=36898 /ORGANISM="Pyramimonas sp., Strain CCMP2087" /LENGTH=521 /DNA_ID=CAMNT_0043913051 /DNA_START=292 /DNA_END=1857 /DNA_ORIENTATION=-